jgi:REP element-mobilizing transposase RayT
MFNEEWDDNVFPLAYLITIRTYGTWLHGDERGAVDMHGKNVYGTPRILPDLKLKKTMSEKMKQSEFLLDEKQQSAVEEAIKQVCLHRKYYLHAINAETNHAHTVVSAQVKPEIIADSFKSYSTRKLRELNLVSSQRKIWSRGRSRCYLWKPRDVALAIEYVLYGQGDISSGNWSD